jgi:thiamine pyrophosphokinase
MTILIIANGSFSSRQKISEFAGKADVIIAADGGANLCAEYEIKPTLIIGDFDSIALSAKRYFQDVKQIYIQEQESTDLEKALSYALSFQPHEIQIFSLFGNRLDHTFANAIIMRNFAEKHDISITLFDDSGVLKLWKSGSRKLTSDIGKTVSFFSLNSIQNLTLKGFEYEVMNQNYKNNFIGVSNKYAKEECEISFSEGILFQFDKNEN